MIGAVSAENETDIVNAQDMDSQEPVLEESSQQTIAENSSAIQTTIKSEDTNIVKGNDFSVKLTDNNGTAIANKTIKFTVNKDTNNATTDNDGEFVVVNIQKFEEAIPQAQNAYDSNIQRVFFIDEAHRSYALKGVYFKNLILCDPNAVFVALTGTPLLSKKERSNLKFGDYIHKYFYDKSIADGYTLRIKKEKIDTVVKTEIKNNLDFLEKMQFVDSNAPKTRYMFTADLYRLFFRNDKRLHMFEERNAWRPWALLDEKKKLER